MNPEHQFTAVAFNAKFTDSTKTKLHAFVAFTDTSLYYLTGKTKIHVQSPD